MIRYRLIAPAGLAPTTLELTDGFQIAVPADGIVEIPRALTIPGDSGVFEPVDRVVETGWLRLLLALGFRHLPASGPSDARPARGRYVGEMFFDESLGRPFWWSGGAWRGADGEPISKRGQTKPAQ